MVALFYTHQQGATHRGARRQEPLVSRLPTAALSDVASVDKAIPPYARAPPHTQAAPSMPAVPTHPRGFLHMQVLFPHTFPRRPQPHTPARIPIDSAGSPHVSTASPCNLQAPKIPTLVSTRPAFPARYRMSGRGINPPRPATGLLKPTHPTGFPQIPCANDGEANVRAWRRLATRRRRRSGGLHSSPPEGGLLRRGSPGNRSRLDSTKVRRCGVRAAGSAGRMTDHAGRRPDRASCWSLGS